MKEITLNVNGVDYDVGVTPSDTLAKVLRNHLNRTDVKLSCCEGECGACTVLLDGKPVNSCLMLAVQAEGFELTTVAGLANAEELHPLQQKFSELGALQCGYCTPGMLLSAKALLDANNTPTETEVRAALSGNICRCTGYQQVVEAVMATAADCDQ